MSSPLSLSSLDLLRVPPFEKSSTFSPSPVWRYKKKENVIAPTTNTSDDGTMTRVDDSTQEKSEGIVLALHEWWGLTDFFKLHCLNWFSSDFSVAILDLYRGVSTTSVDEASHLMNQLDFAQALRDIRETCKYLKQTEGYSKICLVGFGLGACLALAAAVHLKDINGCVILYGIPDSRLASPTKVTIPLQLHFGSSDVIAGFSDPKAQAGLEKQLVDHSVPHEFYRYDGCGHGFASSEYPNANEAEAAKRAKERASSFIKLKFAGK